MKSGFDYETTGETPDWSYYATRGLAFTFEIMKTQSTNNTYPEVIEDYLGTGRYAGKSNRDAFMVAWKYAANPAGHSIIKGNAPRGAVLKITKDFDLWTVAGQGRDRQHVRPGRAGPHPPGVLARRFDHRHVQLAREPLGAAAAGLHRERRRGDVRGQVPAGELDAHLLEPER